MKTEISTKKAIQILAGTDKKPVANFIARVVSVDKTKLTAILEDEGNDLELEVLLKPVENANKSAFLVFPKVDSYVLCARIENGDDFAISMTSEIDEIWLGGNKYSLVKTEDLITELNKTNETVTAILNAINNALPASGASDGGAGLQASMKSIIAGKQVGNFTNIKNTQVKHG